MRYPTIILLRHGETEWNVESRYQGQLDSPLTSKGEQQVQVNAFKLMPLLKACENVKFFSSPLGRAKSSAFIIADFLEIPRERIIFDARIQEFSYGIFEGKTKKECQMHYAEVFKAREQNKWSYQIEKGESYCMATKRLQNWLLDVQGEEMIIVMAHEMINRTLRGLYCDLDPQETLALRQPNDLVLILKNKKEYILH